jgi:hypothetical protein
MASHLVNDSIIYASHLVKKGLRLLEVYVCSYLILMFTQVAQRGQAIQSFGATSDRARKIYLPAVMVMHGAGERLAELMGAGGGALGGGGGARGGGGGGGGRAGGGGGARVRRGGFCSQVVRSRQHAMAPGAGEGIPGRVPAAAARRALGQFGEDGVCGGPVSGVDGAGGVCERRGGGRGGSTFVEGASCGVRGEAWPSRGLGPGAGALLFSGV